MRRTSLAVTLGAILALTVTSCGDTAESDADAEGGEASAEAQSLVLYSGRNEELIQPLIDTFSEETGIEVEVRYGDTAELAAQILEEGEGSPADVFLAQDAGALGAVAAEDLFDELDAELLEQVPEAYRDAEDQWVGLSGRVRTLIYNTDTVDEADLPASVDELTGADYTGRVGVAPTNASFQSFVTAHREIEGEEQTQSFLDDLAANDPQIREGNGEIVTDVAEGVIDMGLVNHYYLYSRAKELGESPEELNVANHLFNDGDVGSLVNVAGVGVLNSENPAAASLAEFMLSTEGQTYFAEETAEYPLIEGVDGPEGMPSLEELDAPEIDLNQLDDLETSVEMIIESGLVG
ncbi:iron ABC transporter substrate-binding protein [Nesterenkonia jeotgali]|uniref:Iron ABC transporter substrate-binding protein n=1 Tax=Nesterenkonia jeotgali TaxID=317018 RepID=A0A0W8IC59_9MICC|nr:iron ABC transporter substrate-binding protein [Nesterenkonia jeotgali]KUG57537.1 iron ABC transporter substrate-binding protein [Nesterenkonia jeotgali]MBA8922363.1 iron(III) transport system substrate-binding protein [Nesterenkonia jeotgali]